MLRGSTEILNIVCDSLGGIKPGQTTKDGKFTVIEVECQGACSNAPMMAIGDDFYVRGSTAWDVYRFSDLNPATGRPHCRDDEEDIGRVLKRAEAKTRATERSPDQRELCGFDSSHVKGLFPLFLTILFVSYNPSSHTALESSAPQSLVRS
jgi:hypothetical protein